MSKMKFYGDQYGPEHEKWTVIVDEATIRTKQYNPSTHETDNVYLKGYKIKIAKGHEWSRTSGPTIVWSKECLVSLLEENIKLAEAEVEKLTAKYAPRVDPGKDIFDKMGFQ